MKKYITPFLLLTVFFLMLLYPEPVKTGALEGLTLWYNSVVPILLPFLILSNGILATDSLSLFLRPFFLAGKMLPGLNPWIFYPLFFGLFCGFPMGGKAIRDLLQSNKISTKEASFLLPIVNQASPMFMAGYVGVHILKNELSLGQILFFLYTPPLCLFLIYIIFSCFKSSVQQQMYKQKNSMSRDSEHTIWNAFTVIVIIGIYMMLFTIGQRLCQLLLPNSHFVDLALSALEFSTGLHRISHLDFLNPGEKTGIILALTSFGGFCTALQTMSVMKDTKISLFSYLVRKLLLSFAVYVMYMVLTNS